MRCEASFTRSTNQPPAPPPKRARVIRCCVGCFPLGVSGAWGGGVFQLGDRGVGHDAAVGMGRVGLPFIKVEAEAKASASQLRVGVRVGVRVGACSIPRRRHLMAMPWVKTATVGKWPCPRPMVSAFFEPTKQKSVRVPFR